MARQSYRVEGRLFSVPPRYEPMRALGRGAFGIVCSARDKEARAAVAIKKIEQPFRSLDNARKLVREIRLLRHFREHRNVVGLIDILMPKSADYDSVYLVTELMETDLGRLLKGPTAHKLTQGHYTCFLYQMLCGLRAIHAAKVMHRDMKPANIFVSADCSLKIGDLGLARDDDDADALSGYVVTRWYRAPELLMQWDKYDKAVDVWSLGCIFAEMLAARHGALFPGNDHRSQLEIILDFIGTPEEEDYRDIGSQSARAWLQKLPKKQGVHHATFTVRSGRGADAAAAPERYFGPNVEPAAFDLLSRMLVFNPRKRIDAESCLYHDYLGDHKWLTPEERRAAEAGEADEDDDDVEDRRLCGVFNCRFESYLRKPGLSDEVLVDRAVRIVNQEVCCMHAEFETAPGVAERLPPAGEIPRDTFVPEGAAAPSADP
eukprot:TRINITY_DN8593_c0_g3_i1.p1 TRINITY_DN8593_c0_g3~~TRINITY_DN8593_c0_g3_i1.p1  ORF type:complete len:461 (+),score=133.61 TRINITY_DN8593_c0_g3_i1:86-1384(+)